jgi:hypothetical protein
VRLELSELPSTITRCNCSICLRLGVLWAYYSPDKVKVSFSKEKTAGYIWGDEYLEFHHCIICGCSTHYTVTKKYLDEYKQDRIAVNFRLAAPDVVVSIPVREFDGANL